MLAGAALLAASIAALVLPVVPAAAAGRIRPPVMPQDRPDPELVHDGSRWFAYSTNLFWEGHNVPVMRSTTLDTWTNVGDALPNVGDWASEGFTWAPGVVKLGSTWVMYYTAMHTQSQRQCIGRAVSTSAAGPFVDDSSAPLVCQLDRGGSIDADPYVDRDGSAWLVWKSDDNALGAPTTLWMQSLSADGLSLLGSPAALLTASESWQQGIVENPSLVRVEGELWLFYSGGWWDSADYSIGYAKCAGRMAPCSNRTQTSPWMSQASTGVPGVGGASVLVRPNVAPVIAFHGWTGAVSYEAGGVRSGFIEPLDFSSSEPTWRPDRPRNTVSMPRPAPRQTSAMQMRSATWYLANHPTTGVADQVVRYGDPGDVPVVGDWDGDGTTTIGVFRRGRWYLRNQAGGGVADIEFGFGQPDDIPVVGRWVEGDPRSYPGVIRGTRLYARGSHTSGVADLVASFGETGDVLVVGDWDGDGTDTLGAFLLGRWYVSNSLASGFADHQFAFGDPGDAPIAGRWVAGERRHLPGVVRQGTWYLRNTQTSGVADLVFGYGDLGDIRVVGDWDGDGRDSVGVAR